MRRRITLLAAVTILAAGGSLAAHDFWLIPDLFDVVPASEMRIRGQTSTRFPTSVSAVTPDRVVEARVVSSRDVETITDLSVSGTSLMLRHRPVSDGQRVVGVALQSRPARSTPAAFRRYLALEGNAALAGELERRGEPRGDSVTRHAAKYAKTFVEVGRSGPRVFDRALGHPAEFVPLSDPAALHAGDTLRLRLLASGTPVAHAEVHAGWAESLTADSTTPPTDFHLSSDAHGVVAVPVAQAGLWNVRAVYAAPDRSSTDWNVSFVTIVFRVAGH